MFFLPPPSRPWWSRQPGLGLCLWCGVWGPLPTQWSFSHPTRAKEHSCSGIRGAAGSFQMPRPVVQQQSEKYVRYQSVVLLFLFQAFLNATIFNCRNTVCNIFCHMVTNNELIITMLLCVIVCSFFLTDLSLMCMYPLHVVPPLIGAILRLLQIRGESKPDDSGEDEQLQTLSEIMTEFLSDICLLISKVFLKRRISAVMAAIPSVTLWFFVCFKWRRRR